MRFQAFAKKLEELDEIASNLQSELFAAAQGTRDDDPLTPRGYQAILREVLQEESDEESAIWHAIYYRRCGIETCGELRRFLGRSDILQLYAEWSARSPGNAILRALSGSKETFWQTCGTRMEWARQFLESQSEGTLPSEAGTD